MRREPKSEWCRLSLHTDRHREAVRSWFGGVAEEGDVPIKANLLERIADGTILKVRVLLQGADGKQREMVRTDGARLTITIKPPSKLRWA